MWLDSKAVNCPQKWGNFIPLLLSPLVRADILMALSARVFSVS